MKLRHVLRKVIWSFQQPNTTGKTESATPVIAAKEPYEQPSSYLIELNEYQIANLRAVINAAGYPANYEHVVHFKNPLEVIHTGDWLGEIYWLLPEVDHKPNVSALDMAREAQRWNADLSFIVSEKGITHRND